MNCKNCNQEISKNTKFCPNCGINIEKSKQIVDTLNHEQSNDLDNTPLNITKTQKNKQLGRKLLFALICMTIISVISITLYKIFSEKESNLTNSTNIEKLESSKENIEENEQEDVKEPYHADGTLVTVDEALMIAGKAIPAGQVSVVSDKVEYNNRLFYQVDVHSTYEDVNRLQLDTLYVDKKTGEVYITNKPSPGKPWVKVEDTITKVYKDEKNGLYFKDTYPTEEVYYSIMAGAWTNDEGEDRVYSKEGYYVDIGGLNMVDGKFTIENDVNALIYALKYYKESPIPNVFTRTKNNTSKTQTYDIKKYEDVITDELLSNSILIDVKNNKKDLDSKGLRAEYKELVIFTSDDYKQCKIYTLKTGANIVLEEVGDFFKVENYEIKNSN